VIDAALQARWLREDTESLVRLARWVLASYTDATIFSEDAIDALARARKILEVFGTDG